jgi:hypothetical protein
MIHDNKVAFASIFLCLFHLHYLEEYMYESTIDHAKVTREVWRIIQEIFYY